MAGREPGFWGSDESNLWDEVSEHRTGDYDKLMAYDANAMHLFSAGWLESNHTPEERSAIRDAFFDYAIEEGYFYDRDEFDWEAWREYMGYE